MKKPVTRLSEAEKIADSLFIAMSEFTYVGKNWIDSVEKFENSGYTRYIVEYFQKAPFEKFEFFRRPYFAFEFYANNTCSIINRFMYYPDYLKINLISSEQAVRIALGVQKEPCDSLEKMDFKQLKSYRVKCPEAILTYVYPNDKNDKDIAVLCWLIKYSNSTVIFVDAINGNIIHIDPLISPQR